MGILRRHRRYRVSLEQNLVRRQNVIAGELQPLVLPAQPLLRQSRKGQVGGRHHGINARQGRRRAGIQRLDAGVGIRTPQRLAGQQPRQADVRPVLRPAGHLIYPVRPHRPLPHHRILPFRQDDVRRHLSPLRLRLHLGFRVQHRPHNLVIPRAAAQIPRQPVANSPLVGIRLPIQQRLAGHDKPRRADATL